MGDQVLVHLLQPRFGSFAPSFCAYFQCKKHRHSSFHPCGAVTHNSGRPQSRGRVRLTVCGTHGDTGRRSSLSARAPACTCRLARAPTVTVQSLLARCRTAASVRLYVSDTHTPISDIHSAPQAPCTQLHTAAWPIHSGHGPEGARPAGWLSGLCPVQQEPGPGLAQGKL